MLLCFTLKYSSTKSQQHSTGWVHEDQKSKLTSVQTVKSKNIFVLIYRNLCRRIKMASLFKKCTYKAVLFYRSSLTSTKLFCRSLVQEKLISQWYWFFLLAIWQCPAQASFSFIAVTQVYVPPVICFSWLLFFFWSLSFLIRPVWTNLQWRI